MNSASNRTISKRSKRDGVDAPCVLAVIDVLDTPRNEAIVERAAKLAKQIGAQLHVATTYPTIDSSVRRCQVVRFLPALHAKARERRRGALVELLRRLAIQADAIHVEAGTAEQIIEKLSANLHPRAVVGSLDGTVSESRVGDQLSETGLVL